MLWQLMQARQLHEGDDGGGEGGGEKSDAQSKNANPGGKEGADKGGDKGEKESFKAIASQDELDRIVKDRLARQKESLKEQIRADLKAEAEKAKAKEDGDWKTLFETEKARADKAAAELEAERLTSLKNRIGAKHKLPQALINRLIGATEDEIEADAKAVAKEIGVREAPDNDMGKGEKNAGKPAGDRPDPKKTSDDKPVYDFNGQRLVPFPRS